MRIWAPEAVEIGPKRLVMELVLVLVLVMVLVMLMVVLLVPESWC